MAASLEVFLIIDNQLGDKRELLFFKNMLRKGRLVNNCFSFYLECTGAWLLLLGSGILVVCGHGEPISKEETGKENI